MRLIKCYIENFGILHTQDISFSKGLNCCISENGTGKTTLTAFIEAMLYGIGDSRKQSLDENPRKKYTPWQGGKFGGSLTVEVGKKRYVIERSFGTKASDDTFRLIDADTGKVSDDYGEDIGEKLFGIDRDGFLRTVFLSEKNLQGKNDNKTISAKLSDLVGVDGDVGGIDDAINLLSVRRKFYHKKGNTGEIANVKAKIIECERKLDNLTRLEGEVRAKEEKLTEIANELSDIAEKEANEKKKLDDLRKQRERGANEERYASMLASLNSEKEKLKAAREFFAAGVPTTSAVDCMRDTYLQAKRMKEEAMSEKGSEEYVMLSEFFKNGTSLIEITDMQKAAQRRDEITRECENIDKGFDSHTLEMRKIFSDKVPTAEEIEEMEKATKSSRAFIRALLFILGLGSLALGVILAGTLKLIGIGAGAFLILLSIIFCGKSKKSKEMLALARKYNGCECSSLTNIVSELKNKIARYEALAKEKEDRHEALKEEFDTLSQSLFDFLGKFPHTVADTIGEAVSVIKNKYELYRILSQSGEVSESGKIEKIRTSDEMMKTVTDFLAKYPTVTSTPFAEIRDNISNLTFISANVTSMERECDLFAVKHGVTGKVIHGDVTTEAEINTTITELVERAKAITKVQAVINSELTAMRYELEKKDEYVMEKEELEELYARYVDNLEIILKTSALLTEACDNITSKYLGKTKAKFEEYSGLISGTAGEYTLSTSFELTKTERGEAHGIESYSRGTRDLYALGLRLALADALYENESPFIILDDPFIALDDARLEKAKATLKAIGKTKQILYFTCTKARAID